MTEDKQALIEWLKPQIDELQNVSDEIPFWLESDSAMHLNTMRVALAALTAQPVKLPSKADVKMGGDAKTRSLLTGMNMMRKNCADAIRAAGYEVQE